MRAPTDGTHEHRVGLLVADPACPRPRAQQAGAGEEADGGGETVRADAQRTEGDSDNEIPLEEGERRRRRVSGGRGHGRPGAPAVVGPH